MSKHHFPLKLMTARIPVPPPRATTVPDNSLLDDEPQLASVAVLQTALPTAEAALNSAHGFWGETYDAVVQPDPDALVLLLGRLVSFRCRELSDLLVSYRLAINKATDSSVAPRHHRHRYSDRLGACGVIRSAGYGDLGATPEG